MACSDKVVKPFSFMVSKQASTVEQQQVTGAGACLCGSPFQFSSPIIKMILCEVNTKCKDYFGEHSHVMPSLSHPLKALFEPGVGGTLKVSILRRLRQEGHELEAIMSYSKILSQDSQSKG